jgi:hypothetical protein
MAVSFQEHCACAITRRRHRRSASSRSTTDYHHIGFLADADFPRRLMDRPIVRCLLHASPRSGSEFLLLAE